MARNLLTKDGDFIVGEEKIINYVLAFLFFALFLYGLIDAIRRNFMHIDYQSYVFALAILPAIYCLKRAKSQRVYIRINKTGIYHDGKLISRWQGLIKAYVTQDEKKPMYDIRDRFILVIEYRKEGVPKPLRRKIPLTNTQNKSEEEVVAAVQFFWKKYTTNIVA